MIDMREYANQLLQDMAQAQLDAAEFFGGEEWRRQLREDESERRYFEEWLDRSKPCK